MNFKKPNSNIKLTFSRYYISFLFLTSILILQACSGESPHEKLNGRWTSDIMTMEIDFEAGTYSGVALGKQFNNEIKLVSESPEVVVFTSDGEKITAQFQDNGDSILLTKEGGVPIKFERAN